MSKHKLKSPFPTTRNGKSCVLLDAFWKHLYRAYGQGAADIFAVRNGLPKPVYRVKATRA